MNGVGQRRWLKTHEDATALTPETLNSPACWLGWRSNSIRSRTCAAFVEIDHAIIMISSALLQQDLCPAKILLQASFSPAIAARGQPPLCARGIYLAASRGGQGGSTPSRPQAQPLLEEQIKEQIHDEESKKSMSAAKYCRRG